MTDIDLAVDVGDVGSDSPRFNRRIALAVACIALVGSLAGYIRAVHSAQENEAARQAAAFAVDRVADTLEADLGLIGDGSTVLEAQVLQARRVLEDARALEAVPGSTAEQVAEEASDRLAVLADLALGQARFGSMSDRFNELSNRLEASTASAFSEEAASDLAAAHGSVADATVAVLALLAVGLFLLGLSLTATGSARAVLVVPGALVALAGTAWTVQLGLTRIDAPSEGAILATARASQLANLGEGQGAVALLDQVLEDEPDYGRALAVRATARVLDIAGERGDPFSNLHYVDPSRLDDALDDAARARDLGLDDDLTNAAILGFLYLNDGDGDRAAQVYEQLLERNDSDAFSWYALGAARVMQGDEDGAAEAYEEGRTGLDDMIESGQFNLANLLVAAAYTDAERALQVEDRARGAVDEMRGDLTEVVFRIQMGEEPTSGGAEIVGELNATQSGRIFAVSGSLEGDGPATAITSFWLIQRPGDEGAPFGVPTGSGTAPMVISLPGADGFFAHQAVNPSGALGNCVVPGTYRVDVYAGRRLGASAVVEVPESPLGRLTFSDNDVTDVGVCRPADWDVERGENRVVYADPESPDRIEVLAFPTDAAQRALDPVDAAVALLEAREQELGLRATTVNRDFPVLGFADNGANACVLGAGMRAETPEGTTRFELAVLAPDGVLRIVAFETPDEDRIQTDGLLVVQSTQLRGLGEFAPGEEFAACPGG